MWLWWIAASLAAEPEVRAAADGTVTGSLLIAADSARVRTLVNGPVMRGELSPDVYSVVVTADGACQSLDTSTRGLWRPLRVRSRWCPTATGFVNSLVQSDDFSAYGTEWTITPVSGGTTVEIRVLTLPRVAVPQSLITEGTRQSVTDLLVRLAKEALKAD